MFVFTIEKIMFVFTIEKIMVTLAVTKSITRHTMGGGGGGLPRKAINLV